MYSNFWFRVAPIVFLAAGLAGCNGLNQRYGLSPIIEAGSVQAASQNSTRILNALAADAGFREGEAVDYYLVAQAGFNYIDDQCRSYFNELFFIDRGKDQIKSGISVTGPTTAAILDITQGSRVTMAVVAQVFGFGYNATELLAGTFLYQLPPATTQAFVAKLQAAFREGASENRASINTPTAAYHMIQRYLDLCLPQRIEAEITKQIRGIER